VTRLDIQATKTLVETTLLGLETRLAEVEDRTEHGWGGGTGSDEGKDTEVRWVGILGYIPRLVRGRGRAQ
jgi:hypothetical protein